MHLKRNISLVIFLLVNLLFAVKYFSRYSQAYVLIAFFLLFFYAMLWHRRVLVNGWFEKLGISYNFLLILYTAAGVCLLYLIPKEFIKVDRWSVIDSYWTNFFHGEYVYYARSFDGNYPGPMPFYFVLALPFYVLGELGLYSLSGILVFAWLMKKKNSSPDQDFIPFLMVACSVWYVWEICGRSNIFINGSLVLVSLVYFFEKYQKRVSSDIYFGMLFGLLLSTRNVFVIAYIIALLFALRSRQIDIKNLFRITAFAVMAFTLTFLPFVWNHVHDFFRMNPFIIQSSFLMPLPYTVLFVLISVVLSLACRQRSDVYFYIGLNLFITILFYFSYVCLKSSWNDALFASRADVSYFILCLPFVLFYLRD